MHALPSQSSEPGGGGTSSRFSLRSVTAKLRGGDTSIEARLLTAVKELQEAERNVEQADKELA